MARVIWSHHHLGAVPDNLALRAAQQIAPLCINLTAEYRLLAALLDGEHLSLRILTRTASMEPAPERTQRCMNFEEVADLFDEIRAEWFERVLGHGRPRRELGLELLLSKA